LLVLQHQQEHLSKLIIQKSEMIEGWIKAHDWALTISAKPVGVGSASQPWILAGEQSGLPMRIATTENASLCVRMKSWVLFGAWSGDSVVSLERPSERASLGTNRSELRT